MVEVTDEIREAVGRAMATIHYCERFEQPADSSHVQMNVDGNWHTFLDTETMAALQTFAPLIEAQAIERAAKVAGDAANIERANSAHADAEDMGLTMLGHDRGAIVAEDIATAIRALVKEG